MNKRIHIYWLLVFCIAITSCRDSGDNPGKDGSLDVELLLVPPGSSATRTKASTDNGSDFERTIAELDVLIFDQGVFAYSRQAYRMEGNRFRFTLQETDHTLTAYLFANSRSLLRTWEAGDHKGRSWESIQQELIDRNPARLTEPYVWLPMWGKISGTVSSTHVNEWGTVNLLRSVASVDLYVEQNDQTQLFQLTDLYIYFGPDQGYLAPGPSETESFATPAEMKTILELHADESQVEEFTVMDGGEKKYRGIASYLYLYDNDITVSGTSDTRKFTRVVMGGYYNQTGPAEGWEKSYYPLDFVYDDGNFRPIIRNWKYEFRVTGVFGPGYKTPDTAAENYPVDINTEFIPWNNEDVEIGVKGHYYVSKERNNMYLSRNAESTDAIRITYRIYDESTDKNFRLSFKGDQNGTEIPVADGVRNDYYEALLINDTDNHSARLEVKALQNYTSGHDTETLEITFRDLTFTVAITQYDLGDDDWDLGGNQDEELDD